MGFLAGDLLSSLALASLESPSSSIPAAVSLSLLLSYLSVSLRTESRLRIQCESQRGRRNDRG